MKKALICLSLLMVLLLVACAKSTTAPTQVSSTAPTSTSAPAPQTVTLRFAVSLPPGDMVVVAAQKMADNFNQRAAGKYKIEVYPGGQLASMDETFNMLRTNAIQIAESPIEYQTSADPRFAAHSLPFMFNGIKATQTFLKSMNDSIYGDIIASKFNSKPIATFVATMHNYCGVKKAVKTLADWKGLLVWVSDPIEADTVKALGAEPVSIPFFDGYPALQKGTVDAGVALGLVGVWNFKWYDAIHYITIANMFGSSGYFYVNLDVFNGMPPDIQQALLDEAKTSEIELQDSLLKYDQESMDGIKAAGTDIYMLPDTERAKWLEASQAVTDNFFAQIGQADAQKIKDAVAKANK